MARDITTGIGCLLEIQPWCTPSHTGTSADVQVSKGRLRADWQPADLSSEWVEVAVKEV